MRAQAEIYYGDNSGYSSAAITTLPAAGCTQATSVFIDPVFVNAIAGITNSSGVAPTCVLGGTSAQKASSWAMSGTLKKAASTWWCVDSSGASKEITTTNISATKTSC